MPPKTQISKKKRLLIAAGIFSLPVIGISIALIALFTPKKKAVSKVITGSAFNTQMPTPNLPQKERNKLEVYMQAEQDSMKQNENRQKDPYANPSSQLLPGASVKTLAPSLPTLPAYTPHAGVITSPFADDNDKKVTDRLEKIYSALGNAGASQREPNFPSNQAVYNTPDQTLEIAKLERLMQNFQKRDTTSNPELTQVKQVLDEIKDIQHPEQTRSFNHHGAQDPEPLPVGTRPVSNPDSSSWIPSSVEQNGFYGFADEVDSSPFSSNSIEAVVHADQTVQTGSFVKLRLLQPIFVGNVQIPANTFIYGSVSITGERVSIELTNAICNNHIYPISMKVYDGADGLAGLYVPGMITRDVVKQNMSQGIGGVSLGTLDPSLGAQAAAASIETAKNLLSHKIAIVKATLKAGTLAILKSNTMQHQTLN